MEQFKRAKVIMLPTENFTSITKPINGNELKYWSTRVNASKVYHRNQHLYIVSNDEIKADDWCILLKDHKNYLFKALPNDGYNNCKKIIATTNTTLQFHTDYHGEVTNDETKKCYSHSLPQPSPQFITKYIEEYNKGNIITEVLVEYRSIINTRNHIEKYQVETLKINPKDNTINIKLESNQYTKEQLIKAMIWAENNVEHYTGTDKEGQLKQFNEYINKF